MIHHNAKFPLGFNQIRMITALISLLFSVAAFYFDDVINRDGVMYMEMAQAYLDGGLEAMAKIYNWPLFAILVACISKLLSSPLELTASAINSVLFVLFTDALLLISHRILPNLRQVLIAAILILSFYTINDYRDFIIRDIGYWAFSGLALYQLIRFLEHADHRHAIFWQLSVITAVLFRVEGLVILLAMPLYVFVTQPCRPALKQLVQLNSIVIPATILLIMISLSYSGWVQAFDKLGSYLSYLNTEASELQQLKQKLNLFEKEILSPFSADYSTLILFSGLSVMMLYKLFKGLSISYLLLLGLAVWQQKQAPRIPWRGLIVYFTIVNILILTAFLFKHYFVVSRYCIMAIVGVFLLILPRLTQLIEQSWQQKKWWLFGLSSLIILAGVIDTFHTTSSKAYIKNTAIWAGQNLAAESRVLTNDEFIQYYFNTRPSQATLDYRPGGLKYYQAYDYVIVVEKKRYRDLLTRLEQMQLELIYHETSKRNNQASVYRVISDGKKAEP
ncbi:hypothetical protein [Methylophaga sp. OBS4]|uniref:hypothetical protein n=1 Tax=Methylophaga sp. OBS4 TaxID=2991935 RepID=UPI00225B592C|nr:hypothetical protein [Methylophaga sp. OBS4]MCX4187628.1 hypothetical protein [Methylophaga sp. OBS4]